MQTGFAFLLLAYPVNHLPSVLWRCWLGGRKGIRPVWSKVQTCIWPSWCHCHSQSLASVKSRVVLLVFLVPADLGSPGKRAVKRVCVCVCVCVCYWLTQVVLEKRPLNGCFSVRCCCVKYRLCLQTLAVSLVLLCLLLCSTEKMISVCEIVCITITMLWYVEVRCIIFINQGCDYDYDIHWR